MKFYYRLMTITVLFAAASGCVPFGGAKYHEIVARNEQYAVIIEGLEKEIKRLNLENENLRLTCQDLKLKFEEAWAQRRRLGGLRKGPKTFMWCDPDGEVTLADNKRGICWVNLQQGDGVKAGTIFGVFRYVKGGRRKAKGRIEIKKSEDKRSQAVIIESLDPKNDPIVKGDHIINPFFDKREVKQLVFVGELINTRFTKKKASKLIEELGAKVAPEITVETDFLIAGRGAEESEEYQRAVDLGITILSEKELLKYIAK